MRQLVVMLLYVLVLCISLRGEDSTPPVLSCDQQVVFLRATARALDAQRDALEKQVAALRAVIVANNAEREAAAYSVKVTRQPLDAYEAIKAEILTELGQPTDCQITIEGAVECPDKPESPKP